MGQKVEDFGDKMKVPGPGTYDSSDINLIKDTSPAYTMRPRTESVTDKTPRPAPNAYSPEKNEVGYSLP